MRKRFGEFEFDEQSRKIIRKGLPVKLTGQTLDLLCLFLQHPGELISREMLHRHLWSETNVEFDHSLDVLLNRLRATLGESGRSPRYIETVPRKGYRFLAPVSNVKNRPAGKALLASMHQLWIYGVIALLAALIVLLLARTRYDRFIPRQQHALRVVGLRP